MLLFRKSAVLLNVEVTRAIMTVQQLQLIVKLLCNLLAACDRWRTELPENEGSKVEQVQVESLELGFGLRTLTSAVITSIRRNVLFYRIHASYSRIFRN